MQRQYYVVDVFAHERYTGNAAAVVLDADELSDAEMQSIAGEFNLSETTFVLPPETRQATLRFRWFTPTTEVTMCGHATIAGVHALAEAGRLPPGTEPGEVGERANGPRSATDELPPSALVETRSGVLSTFVEDLPGGRVDQMIWLETPRPVLVPYPVAETRLARALGLAEDAFDASLPAVKTQDGDLLVFVKDVVGLNDARPDFPGLREFQMRRGLRGVCLATKRTLTEAIHVQSRFFAPVAGIDEDPVTGSVHGPLAVYLVMHGHVPMEDRVAALRCTQAKPGGRAGVVYALVRRQNDDGYSVRIGGQAVTTMCGTLQ